MKQRLQAWGDSKIIAIVCCFALNDEGELLLLLRNAKNLGGNRWGAPGGRIEMGETAEAAMRRELWEETGLRPRQLQPLGTHEVRMPHGAVHMTSYQAAVPRDAAVTLRPVEHQAYRWFPSAEVLTDPDIIWGLPTVLQDFGLVADLTAVDTTLADDSQAILLERF